jgi:hypothetical protein
MRQADPTGSTNLLPRNESAPEWGFCALCLGELNHRYKANIRQGAHWVGRSLGALRNQSSSEATRTLPPLCTPTSDYGDASVLSTAGEIRAPLTARTAAVTPAYPAAR